MLVLSDVHFALEPLRRVVASGETLLILGDLVNLTDYRTGEGAVADVLGMEFARASASARGSGDYQRMRGLWLETVGDRIEEVREAIREAIGVQYERVAEVLEGGHGYVIHGNVDRPRLLADALPNGYEYVHGETRDIDGLQFGFVGGATVLGLYGVLCYRIWRTAQIARDTFGSLVCIGVLAMFAFSVFQNVGMAMGIMPVTGIPLLLLSSGGSSTLTAFAGLGLVLNVHMRRFR